MNLEQNKTYNDINHEIINEAKIRKKIMKLQDKLDNTYNNEEDTHEIIQERRNIICEINNLKNN